jgi:hypothetical protein
MKLASSPAMNSSMTTRAPPALCFTPSDVGAEHVVDGGVRLGGDIATTTPLPAARPSALMTMGAPCLSTWRAPPRRR